MTMIARLVPGDERLSDPKEPVMTLRIVGADSIAAFRCAMHKATNCWDNAPTEIKELSDMTIHGKLMQNYSALPSQRVRIPHEFYEGLNKK